MWVYGRSLKEIAARTGLSENNVKQLLFKGRKKIEAKVPDLEKKGTKLYGLSPLSFLLFLLRHLGAATEVPAASGISSSTPISFTYSEPEGVLKTKSMPGNS